jgi:hypothetical protein
MPAQSPMSDDRSRAPSQARPYFTWHRGRLCALLSPDGQWQYATDDQYMTWLIVNGLVVDDRPSPEGQSEQDWTQLYLF